MRKDVSEKIRKREEEIRKLEKRAFSPRELFHVYGIPEGSLGNQRLRGEGPKFYRVGRKILYLKEDIEAFIRREPVLTRDAIELMK